SAGEQSLIDQNGGIFIRRAEQFSEEDRILLMTVARVILSDKAGSLADQIDRRAAGEPSVPKLVPIAAPRGRRETPTAAEIEERELIFENGLGGFTPDGKEYVITTTPEQPTPAPWCNVMANPDFGTIISESGVGYSWQLNAREFRLTPWYNDPVSDTAGECFYVRDEESGAFWSPTPLPARGTMPYTTRHGFGYSVFEYAQDGIDTETTVFVHRDEPAKFWLVKVRNTTDRRRRISLSGFVEWVLTDQRSTGAMHTVTSTDPQSGAVFAQNKYNAEFGHLVGVFNVSENTATVTGDRVEFLGRAGSAKQPAAMERTKLSGKVGAGLDPCAAIRTPLDLGPGEEREVVFMLGAGRDAQHARA
ncbi:MAG: cyclic beta 1-2 glucan synthetase, partial [Planctomycetota bacterium]